MKIALVSPHFYPSTKFGGPVISLWGLCKELSKKHEIFVYTTSSGQKEVNFHDNFSYKEVHNNIRCKYYSELINKYFSKVEKYKSAYVELLIIKANIALNSKTNPLAASNLKNHLNGFEI